ncbi:MAG: DUF2867 domain-containing protein [Alphaproteobacteria bacterium]|jgi:hypothetical protein|nr:DUF2867 domain-containing protein [Alphaproteobacteria bacterium]
MAVLKVTPPRDSAIADWYRGADLVDAYAIPRPAGAPRDAGAIAGRLMARPPAFFRVLLKLRDAIMARFGVKTTAALRRDSRPRIDFFPVISRAPHEIVLGEDDRHLDFRLSVLLGPDDQVIATTAVRCHNTLGRVYLAAILPFHVLIVRTLLRRLAQSRWTDGAANII